MWGTPRTVADTGDAAGDQREGEGVQHGVESLQGDVTHLHPPPRLLLGPELVAESAAQAQLPGDVGQVEEAAVLLLHQHLAVHGAQRGGAVGGVGGVWGVQGHLRAYRGQVLGHGWDEE